MLTEIWLHGISITVDKPPSASGGGTVRGPFSTTGLGFARVPRLATRFAPAVCRCFAEAVRSGGVRYRPGEAPHPRLPVQARSFMLTQVGIWNCKHIANPWLRPRIERLCRERGYEPPVICTPQELLEIDDAI